MIPKVELATFPQPRTACRPTVSSAPSRWARRRVSLGCTLGSTTDSTSCSQRCGDRAPLGSGCVAHSLANNLKDEGRPGIRAAFLESPREIHWAPSHLSFADADIRYRQASASTGVPSLFNGV